MQRLEELSVDRPRRPGPVVFLPEPERRPRQMVIISADDHVVEPPGLFDGRLPAKFAERTPRVVDMDGGAQAWLFEGTLLPNVGLNAVAGRPPQDRSMDPVSFADMRRGAYDIDARVADMDIDGVYASVCFPSFLAGFAGARLQMISPDLEFSLAAVRAYNDWHLEDWAGRYPDRFIPCQIPWLHDPVVGAEEIRANAARGFRALTFPEAPDRLGLPSLHTRHWDPMLAACAETDTAICLHVGSGSGVITPSDELPRSAFTVVFGLCASFSAIDWLFSMAAERFPTIKVCFSEGGIGWLPGLVDRLNHMLKYTTSADWPSDVTPAEMLLRNYAFIAVDDPTTFRVADALAPDRIMLEADYPHSDGSWPDTQSHFARQLAGLPETAVRKFAWENASAFFGHPVPESVRQDPNSFGATS